MSVKHLLRCATFQNQTRPVLEKYKEKLIKVCIQTPFMPKCLLSEEMRFYGNFSHAGGGEGCTLSNFPQKSHLVAPTGTRKRSDQIGRAQCLNGANAEAHKRLLDKNRGPISKNGFSGRNPDFWAKKNIHFLILTMFRPRPGKVVKRKKYPFPK